MSTQNKSLLVMGVLLLAGGVAVALWPSKESGRAARRTQAAQAAQAALQEAAAPQEPSAQAPQEPSAQAPAEAAAEAPLVGDEQAEETAYLRQRSVPTLLARLSSDDELLVLDAADGLRARKAVEAIPQLVQHDLIKQPDSARSVIDALGSLAGHADPAARAQAVDRLLQWLEQEKNRTEPDAIGNVLQIYEALGETQDARAAAALEREMLDPQVKLAPKVVLVASLRKLAQPSSPPVLRQARPLVADTPEREELDAEIKGEVLQAIDEALASWP